MTTAATPPETEHNRPTVDQLHYEWHGAYQADRPTVVLLHDGLGAIGSWQQVGHQLSARCHCNSLLYDRWGYGRSPARADFPFGFMNDEAPVLAALLDHLKLNTVHLLGHSDGGSIALLFAALYPQRALSVVTEAAHVLVEERCLDGIRALVAAQTHGEIPGWLKRLHGERADQLLQRWCAGWLSQMHAAWNIERYLGYIEAPLLAIQGHDDVYGTMQQIDSILTRTAHAEDWRIEHCGHTPHAEYAEDFIEHICQFFTPKLHTP